MEGGRGDYCARVINSDMEWNVQGGKNYAGGRKGRGKGEKEEYGRQVSTKVEIKRTDRGLFPLSRFKYY